MRCLSKRKDTNFKANHNPIHKVCSIHCDVCLSAKIRILKQITTTIHWYHSLPRCLSKRKDTNFKANHNVSPNEVANMLDVCLSAKIRILKQITTFFLYVIFLFRCLSKRKDTNFKANHNRSLIIRVYLCDVCLSAKIRILKQITTPDCAISFHFWMFV